MKQINSILRTLCLTALLCMTSVSASAYKVYDKSYDNGYFFYEVKDFLGDDRILVIDGNIEIQSFCPQQVYKEYAFIIMPGVTMTVTQDFYNFSKIYVFGTLKLQIDGEVGKDNYGTIYIVTGGTIISGGGDIKNRQQGKIEIVSPETILTKAKLPGQAPTPTANGWNDYWAKGIESTAHDDFYPMYYYSDEACTEVISDLEAWKTNEGKIDKLGPFTIGSTTGDVDEGYCYHDDITFNDKDLYQSDYDFTVSGNLEYSRTFAATGVWQAWFVPFEVTVSDMNQAGMEVAEIAGVLMDEKEPYIAFAKMTDPYAIVNANTPYVVKATKSSVSMTLTGPDICIRKSTSAELEAQRLTVQSSFDTFTFGGNYQQTNGYANEWYALNTNGIFQKMGKDVYLAPQRFWMTIDIRKDTPYYTKESDATAKAFIGMTVLGDDETTGIESLAPTLSEGNGVIYNLQGQRVTNIQKGQVYIMNGKKFFAR